jgi:hypothetical protein
MTKLISLITERRFVEADEELSSIIPVIMEKKILEMKKATAAKMSEGIMGTVGPDRAKKLRMDVLEEDEIEEEIASNLRDADDLQVKNMSKAFDKPGAIKRIMSPVSRDPKFTKDQSKSPQNSFGVSSDKQDRGLPRSGDFEDKSKEFLRRSTPSKDLKEETEELDEARIKLVKARVRGGKVERRKKVSNVPGMTIRGGQLKRMSAAERRRRKMGARKAKMKRKAKMTRSLMKRKRSLQKRKSLGL